MGYDAYVRCNCWESGKTRPYPFNYGFQFDDQGYLVIMGSQQHTDEYDKRWDAIREWMEDCCEHPQMRLLNLRVANQSEMSIFKWALGEIGWEHFPVLKSGLPQANAGKIEPELASGLVDELFFFVEHISVIPGAFIVNSSTHQIVQIYDALREGVFGHNSEAQVDIGVDLSGFFISKRHQNNDPTIDMLNKQYKVQQPREELFRAMSFEQHRRDKHTIEFINSDNKARYLYQVSEGRAIEALYQGRSLSILNEVNMERFHVDVRHFSHEDFRHIVQSLIYLSQASQAVGNPIVWT